MLPFQRVTVSDTLGETKSAARVVKAQGDAFDVKINDIASCKRFLEMIEPQISASAAKSPTWLYLMNSLFELVVWKMDEKVSCSVLPCGLPFSILIISSVRFFDFNNLFLFGVFRT